MKTLLVIALLVLSQNAHAWGNWYGKYDKHMHIGVSAGMTIAGYYGCRKITDWSKTTCRVVSGLATFAIAGPGKEFSDQNFDNKDMHASGAGTLLGIGITFAF